ncbi:MAG: GAF domain-containing sensor histidine kinase [Nitrospinae bacterium]|nr:GAF domain-containing sensor histidine kinase [Nitrospinota bacterium]
MRPSHPAESDAPSREALLDDIAEALASLNGGALPLEKRLDLLLRQTLSALGAERGSIMLLEGDRLVVRAATDPALIGVGRTLDESAVSATALRERRALLIGKIDEESREIDFYTDGRYKTATLLTLPILFQDEPLGVINVTDKVSRRSFRKSDETILSMFAGMTLAALMGKEAREQRDALARANEELTRMQAFREQLISMIVHDLKGPTGEIIANLNMLADAPLDEFGKELLDNSTAAGESLLRMIMNILDVGKMEEGRFVLNRSVVELTPFLSDAARRLALMARREEKQVDTRLPDAPLTALIDRQVVERVLWNLLSNANNHTGSGDRITLSAEGDERTVVFRVSDSGAGIEADDLPHLFDRYYRGKGSGRYSVGLGLAFCQMAVEAHGGSITVESRRGEGATFIVTLPSNPDHP